MKPIRFFFQLASLLLLLACHFSLLPAQNSHEVARGLLDSASYYIRSGQVEAADRVILKANAIGWETNDSTVILASTIGLINVDMDNPERVDSLLELMHPFVLAIGEDRHYIEYYLDKAHVNNLRMNYGQQIAYVDSALSRSIAAKDSMNIISSYLELANAYQNVWDQDAAIAEARKAIEMSEVLDMPYFQAYGNRVIGISYSLGEHPDSALAYLLRSNELFELEENDYQVAYNSVRIGHCLVQLKRWGEAEKYLASTSGYFDEVELSPAESNQLLQSLARVYLNTERPEMAVQAARQGYAIADSFGLLEDRSIHAEILIRANLLRSGLDQSLMDTLMVTQSRAYEIEKAREVLDLQEKYESKEKERRIAELGLEAKDSELAAQRNRTLLILLLSATIVIALVALLLYSRARERTRRKVNELNRKALQLQINPHFFFNVLNSINHYITDNDQKAARYYLAKFAKLMRLALENSQHETVPLGNELDLVEAYLKLEQMRRDKFDFEIEVDDQLRELKVPPLMLQPFVENSVEHAFPDSMEGKGLIVLRASREGELLRVFVQDNGVGISAKPAPETGQPEGKTSLAISILRKRLSALGKQGGIVFDKGDAGSGQPGTVVRINIPLSLQT